MPPEINDISAVDPQIILEMIARLEYYECKEDGLP